MLIPTRNTTEQRQKEGQIAPTRVSLTSFRPKGASYWPIIAQCTRVRVKTRYLEKFKISTGRIHTVLTALLNDVQTA